MIRRGDVLPRMKMLPNQRKPLKGYPPQIPAMPAYQMERPLRWGRGRACPADTLIDRCPSMTTAILANSTSTRQPFRAHLIDATICSKLRT